MPVETMTAPAKPKATRAAFGEALVELAPRFPEMVVLDADLSKSTMTSAFAEKYPHRHIQLGIAEANLIGTGAGLALAGKIPVITSFACFIAGRFETIRISVAYNQANVKIVGTHAGLGIGEDGYTQMALEDVACLRALPNIVILQPADEIETKQALAWALEYKGPVYLRLTRQTLDPVHDEKYRFAMGKADELRKGSQIMLFATGGLVKNALIAAENLSQKGISAGVTNFCTLEPIDRDYIAKIAAAKINVIITCEDHSPRGGLGSAVAEVLCELRSRTRLAKIAAKGYGESGSPADLYKKHGFDPDSIAAFAAAQLKN